MVPSCVEHLPCVGPVKWVREVAIPTCGKASDRVRELPSAVERAMAEALCRQNPEPDLDLVQPAAVARGKHEREARIGRQPVARRLAPSGINVVGDEDHGSAGIPVSEQVEKREHVGHLPVLRHLHDHAASPNVERCEDVARAVDTRTRPGPGGRDAAAGLGVAATGLGRPACRPRRGRSFPAAAGHTTGTPAGLWHRGTAKNRAVPKKLDRREKILDVVVKRHPEHDLDSGGIDLRPAGRRPRLVSVNVAGRNNLVGR